MTLDQYLDNINQRYRLGNATEHTFRGDLQTLIESLVPTIRATNEPKRQSCGAPDYILTKKDIPVGFIEAKDIGDNDLEGLKKTGHKEQFDRYKASLGNLIFTDYLTFILYREDEFVTKVTIGEIMTSPNPSKGGEIRALPENFATFENLIKDFCTHIGQTIKSSKKLAEMMAGKARLLSEVIEKALNSDEEHSEDSTLKDQMHAFKDILIHDITPKGFADVYAQTIAYGMFAARLHDATLPTFSRQEAYELIPKSNPFLKKLFGYIAGLDVDDRIKWIVDDLVNIFLACNVEEILKNYGKSTKMEDPIIHFYENFLSEYDPKLRKARGVWYTPAPVVNFIVRAVDDILKTEFDLPQGLADTSKTTIQVGVQSTDKRYSDNIKKIDKEVHRVQILDPATGTGTFLAEVVKHVYKKFEGQQGIWSNYVETHLLPRLNGFELLMASYAMAHLKLDLLLTETGFKPSPSFGGAGGGRFRVFLTNSLEEHHPDTGTLFANWLSSEANEANRIKRDTPVMCVIGNPPYSVSSSNKSEWIETLTADYKKDMKERNIQPLSDDYIKFIRFGQHFIDKNGSGILAYISNNSFVDGIIHRQMRKNLLESFDKIYILDLHGNAKKQETCPDGSADENVFDIMQGVSINIFVKTGSKRKNELGKVFQFDLLGKRESKYDILRENSLESLNWNNLNLSKPNYFYTIKDFEGKENYEFGFKIDDIFNQTNAGLATEYDEFAIKNSKKESAILLEDLKNNEASQIISKYQLDKKKIDKIENAIADIKKNKVRIESINYRPFDNRYCIYTGVSNGIMGRPRNGIMRHFLNENITLIFEKQAVIGSFTNIFISKKLVECHVLGTMFSKGYVAPLYLYPESKAQQTIDTSPNPSEGGGQERIPNLNMEIVHQIAEKLGLEFTNEKETSSNPSKGGEQDAISDVSDSTVNNVLGENVLHPSFGGAGGGQTFEDTDSLNSFGGAGGGQTFEDTDSLNSFGGAGIDQTLPDYDEQAKQRPGYITANLHNYPYIKDIREGLKENQTEAEKMMWEYLRNKKTGHKIRRQHVIDNFITDFVCLPKKVVIEIDGGIHLQQKEQDELRTLTLNEKGYKVIRFTNEEVFANPEAVAKQIKEVLDARQTIIHDDDSAVLPHSFGGAGGGQTSEDSTSASYPPPLEGLGEVSPLEGLGAVKTLKESNRVNKFAPIDILDYIYAVLHSPTYREKYKEFLKIDFPRVPFPSNKDTFWQLVKLGGEIRQIHLLESSTVEKYITQYPIDGTNEVTKPHFSYSPPLEGLGEVRKVGKVYINETQYFDNVPEVAWNFFIGGYQPAQKWLKDRKDRTLEFEDILHYQKIIVALTETDRIMREIDKIEIE